MRTRPAFFFVLPLILLGLLMGCASTASGPAPQAEAQTPATTIPATSKFAKLQIGMARAEVHSIIGTAGAFKIIPSGKAWIPFYYGADRTRTIEYYKNEGRLVYSGGNDRLIEIVYDPTEDGYRD